MVEDNERERLCYLVGGFAGCIACLTWLDAEDANAEAQGWTVRLDPAARAVWN